MPNPSVAIIDIGSNSIKVLVAERTTDGRVHALASKTIDARISAGISRATPRLANESMARGVTAVRDLVAFAAPFQPEKTTVVATSAVRDAENGDTFRDLIKSATGLEVRILSGEEEANLIGRGLTCDPALLQLADFYVFDLGGGSLEGLAFRDRRIAHGVSLQLGCVRLTEKFVGDLQQPLAREARAQIAAHVRASVLEKFPFSLPRESVAVGTGGTITTVRAIIAARTGCALDATAPDVDISQLRLLLDELGSLPLSQRQRVEGLPAARADVFPTALATLIAVADAGGFPAYRHSFYNLRFGLAAAVLGLD